MATLPQHRISPDEYVALEQRLSVKHEYHYGQMFAMAGGSLAHGRIQVNLARRTDEALSTSRCAAYPSDVRIVIEAADMATYPDLSIVCGDPKRAKTIKHSIVNPVVIIEVLSPSTESYDRGAKFEQYRKLESLQEYVLVSQHKFAIDLFRLENGHWVLYPLRGEEAMLSLTSAGIEIPLADIYRDVNFEDAEEA